MVKRCRACIMPETYPGITFNADGVCNYCTADIGACILNDSVEYIACNKVSTREAEQNFQCTLEACKSSNARYHCVLGLSGGKDSAYLLYLLVKKFGLRVLAVTVENGFLTQTALANAKYVTDKLTVDHHIIKQPAAKTIFRASFMCLPPGMGTRYYVCANCVYFIRSTLMRTALMTKTPIVMVALIPRERFLGYYETPRDWMLHHGLMPKALIANPALDTQLKDYFFEMTQAQRADHMPRILYPYHAIGYPDNAQEIEQKVRVLDLLPKGATAPGATNCILSKLMPYVDLPRNGYYTWVDKWSEKIRNGTKWRLPSLLTVYWIHALLKLNLLWKREQKHCLHALGLSQAEFRCICKATPRV